jgi:NAD-dependent dihydropyrimidine dehydrogenase PreA subunit
MSGRPYMGIPREDIPWFPTIDAEKCTNCGACKDFCTNDVFALGETSTQVVNPLNCVVGCSSCARICPADAVSFPDQKEFVATLTRLREQYAHR